MSMERFPTPQEIRDAVAGKAGTRQQLLTFIRLWAQVTRLRTPGLWDNGLN
jgi:hypothetical protein